MKLSYIGFFIKESWLGFIRSGIMSIVSVVTISIALILFGMFLLIILNVNNLIDNLSNKMEIVLYIKNIEGEKINSLKKTIESLDGVKKVSFVSKDVAWKSFQESFQGKVSLENILKQNPLPNSFLVKVNDLSLISIIAKKLAQFPEVEDLRYGGELAYRVNKFSQVIKIGGWFILSLLGLATLLIVVNTIRLTVLARRNEIAIMKLVGATDSLIKWPFIIEGLFIGVIGAFISVAAVKISYSFLVPEIQDALPFLPFVFSADKLNWICINVFVTGIFLGFLGGYISVGKTLKGEI